MSAKINIGTFGGNLTRDPEIKVVNDSTVAKISIAWNRRYKTKAGEQREETVFLEAEAWGKTAEFLGQHFTSGKGILIEYQLKMDTWKDKESGNDRSKLFASITRVHFNDNAPGGQDTSGQSQVPAARPAAAAIEEDTDTESPPF